MRKLVNYEVTVSHLDDGAHYPTYTYSDFFTFDCEATDYGVMEMARKHMLDHLELHDFQLEKLLRDPSFISLRISYLAVTKYLECNDIAVQGPARDYAGMVLDSQEKVQAIYSEIEEKLKNNEL